jgi:hypothetical protein
MYTITGGRMQMSRTSFSDRSQRVDLPDFNAFARRIRAEKMLEQQGSSPHVSCPACHFRGSYRLADGRRKCRRCGKKYSPRVRRSHLAPLALKQLALSFWLTVPAATAAVQLGLNVKTVRRHYALMRRGLDLEPLCPAHDPSGGETGNEEGVGICLLASRDGVRIASICCEWISAGRQGPSRAMAPCRQGPVRRKLSLPTPLRELDCSLCLADGSAGEGDRELMTLTRLAAKLCRMERRRPRRRVLQELAFRFNHRGNPGVTALLYDFMKPVGNSRHREG